MSFAEVGNVRKKIPLHFFERDHKIALFKFLLSATSKQRTI